MEIALLELCLNSMWRRLQHFANTVAGGAAIIAMASLSSRVIGLVRDNLFAKTFGASSTLDMYNAAFKVPDFIFNIVVLGALSASFVPVFIQRRTEAGSEAADRLASAVLNIMAVVLLLCAGLGLLFAPTIAHWLMADRGLDQQAGTAMLMRVMLLGVVCFGLSNVFSGVLQAKRKFLAFSIAPILYNLGIIVGILYLYPAVGLVGLAYGVVLGALLHLLVQLFAALHSGFCYQPFITWRTTGVRSILRLMPPRAFALGINQFNLMVMAAFALRMPAGSLTVWTWADNLQNVPINMVGVSLAISAFPVFSQAFAEQDFAKFKQVFSNNFRRLLFLIVPISVGILLLRAQIVRLVLGSFGSGAFDWQATIQTAQVLGVFAIALFAQASIPLLARSFFAHQDTRTTVTISVVTVIANLGLAFGLTNYLGLYGLALAFAISSLLNMLLLLLMLRLKFGDLDDIAIIKAVWRIIVATLAAGLVIHGIKYVVAPLVDMRTFIGILIQTICAVGGGGIVYLGIAYYFHFPELQIVRQQLNKLRRIF